MKFDYSRMAGTADRLIERFGLVGALRQAGVDAGPSFDPARGEPKFSRIVLVEDTSNKYNRETGVMERRTTLYVRVREGVEPTVGDSIMTVGAETFLQSPRDAAFRLRYRVDRCAVVSPGGTPLLYQLEVSL